MITYRLSDETGPWERSLKEKKVGRIAPCAKVCLKLESGSEISVRTEENKLDFVVLLEFIFTVYAALMPQSDTSQTFMAPAHLRLSFSA
jgi:hypothetical protein